MNPDDGKYYGLVNDVLLKLDNCKAAWNRSVSNSSTYKTAIQCLEKAILCQLRSRKHHCPSPVITVFLFIIFVVAPLPESSNDSRHAQLWDTCRMDEVIPTAIEAHVAGAVGRFRYKGRSWSLVTDLSEQRRSILKILWPGLDMAHAEERLCTGVQSPENKRQLQDAQERSEGGSVTDLGDRSANSHNDNSVNQLTTTTDPTHREQQSNAVLPSVTFAPSDCDAGDLLRRLDQASE